MQIGVSLLILLCAVLWYPQAMWSQSRYGFDFPVYYWAGMGDFDKIIVRGRLPGVGWVYKDATAITWWWCKYFDQFTAQTIWYWTMIFASYGIFRRVSNVKYGSSLFALFFPLWQISHHAGNIQPALALLCFSPLGTIAAGIYKPVCFGFVVVHAAALYARHRHNRGVPVESR